MRLAHLRAQPPSWSLRSSSSTSWPALAASLAALRPETPPPTTRMRWLNSPSVQGSGGAVLPAWAIAMRTLSAASIWVSSSPAGWLQTTCSRRLARITWVPSKSKRSVMTRLEQAAMTTWLTVPSARSFLIAATPSSAQKASCWRHSGAFISPATVSSSSTETASPMPQPLHR